MSRTSKTHDVNAAPWIVAGLGWALCFASAGGCSSSPPTAAAAESCGCKHCGECLVCKCNADLACVKVEIDATTPSIEIDGKTYFFCSEQCKQSFLKDPRKYEAYESGK